MLLININLALISWKLSLHCVGAADENHLILAIPIATAQPPSSSSPLSSLSSASSSSSGKEDHLLMGGLGLVQSAGDVSHMVWTTVCYISLLSLCVTICFKMLQYVWYNMLHQHMVWTTICYICSSRQDFHFSSFLIVVHNATEPVPHSNSFLIILGSMRAAAHQVSTHLIERNCSDFIQIPNILNECHHRSSRSSSRWSRESQEESRWPSGRVLCWPTLHHNDICITIARIIIALCICICIRICNCKSLPLATSLPEKVTTMESLKSKSIKILELT